ncbi:hypothetical protein KY290_036983 [Solanum tuberosum]|uniref:Uncharacterized protein n=1 Tax=Solanum tuberosum TaxID=4113 RepID=A0ABQ7TVQ3_SOLTU|nr:hypothetical protein KY290_036983 [Solanum tuberosum]
MTTQRIILRVFQEKLMMDKTNKMQVSTQCSTNPTPITYISDLSDKEVMVGMDGGIQEETTNRQEGVSKGRELSHVMHENLIDPKTDPRAPATSKNADIQSQLQEQTANIIGIEKATKDDMLDTKKKDEDMVHIDDIEGTPSEDPTISTSVNVPK